ncbi:hypothetical protein Skr01_03480 [Sphaerisporangium krabiense]|uniref:Serine/threonine protein kinase n=1 Tax=Sphaerisporangium krabiense TaxID=763782 RepID=A0A7W8Z7S2_9ACTN|nr:serine/threonine-protein kinase [Sphaerisporangium krabiense]MBB5628895.1 serine/threonine protein kinase [Sphaerisporangium krabiense]GII60263.1 hypothetical protein Skr01_03480 [Sphaerisporangium krabiense]
MQSLSAGDPQEIGPYRVVGRLGAGGMGSVYAGVDDTGQRVALKLVHEVLSTDLEFRRRFSREIAVLREVDGACVARVLGSDPGTERPWLATEFIAGPTLEQHVRAQGSLSGDALYGLAAGLAEALVAVHAADVVHRDLKPSNVILSSEGPRLIDFGIARVLDDTAMTHTGTLIGSPGWISPEEYGDGLVGTPADVYGWGMLVLFAATGEPPYGTGRPEVLAYRVRQETPDLEAVPEGLRVLVGRALAKEPEARPAADDVLATVTRIWRTEEGKQAPATSDITTLLQRTWVMPKDQASDWPAPSATELLSSSPPAAAPPTLFSAADSDRTESTTPSVRASVASPTAVTDTQTGAGAGAAEPPESVHLKTPAMPQAPNLPAAIAPKRASPWLHAYIVTAVAVTLITVTAIITNSLPGNSRPVAASASPEAAVSGLVASPSAPPSPTPNVMRTAEPAATKAPSPSGKAVSFKGIVMTLPKGWRLLPIDADSACIESPRSSGGYGAWQFVCRPDAMVLQLKSTKRHWPGYGIGDDKYGFMWSGTMPCLAGGTVVRNPYGSSRTSGATGLYYGVDPYSSRLVYSGLATMGDGRKAYYRNWQIACEVNRTYTTKIWYLPDSKVAFYVLSARPRDAGGHRQIIASTSLLAYKHAAAL